MGGGVVFLSKSFQDFIFLFFGDVNISVMDYKLKFLIIIFIFVWQGRNIDFYFVFFCEFDSIFNQIDQDLLDVYWVYLCIVGQVGREVEQQFDIFFIDFIFDDIVYLIDQFLEVGLFVGKFQFVCFDF